LPHPLELGQAGRVEPLMPLKTLNTLREAPPSVASVVFSAVSDSNGCRSRRAAAEMRVAVPKELSTNEERINE
jgi:hypothetical protein